MLTTEEKELLITDLSRRIKEKPEVEICDGLRGRLREIDVISGVVCVDIVRKTPRIVRLEDVKPILRPLSGMTSTERIDMGMAINKSRHNPDGEISDSGVDNLLLCTIRQADNLIKWMISMGFDYLGLIQKNLAIEKEEGN